HARRRRRRLVIETHLSAQPCRAWCAESRAAINASISAACHCSPHAQVDYQPGITTRRTASSSAEPYKSRRSYRSMTRLDVLAGEQRLESYLDRSGKVLGRDERRASVATYVGARDPRGRPAQERRADR